MGEAGGVSWRMEGIGMSRGPGMSKDSETGVSLRSLREEEVSGLAGVKG